jgi:steroid 5-alpha reductase family enzyme
MLKTIILLTTTLVVLPLVALKLDQPLTAEQAGMLKNAVYLMLTVAFACFITGEITGNCSQVDKIWSIIPVVYAWYFAFASGWNGRLALMAGVATVWGIRLTYNFSRRGAYSWKFWGGEEDYRWEIVREIPVLKGRLRWMLFNLLFISLYQNALLLMITLPMLVALQAKNRPLNFRDVLCAFLVIGFVIIETIADQQQWNFQKEKYKRREAGEKLTGDYERGFVSTGLWAVVRHPNYAAEQAIWFCFYLFSVAATGRWVNWSGAGCLLLMVLFQSSSDFSESISLKKYAAYNDFKKRVPRFFPKLR